MGSLVLGSMLGGGGGGGVTTAPGPAQPAPPAFRQAIAQPPQVSGVQAQQTPVEHRCGTADSSSRTRP